MAGDQFPIPKGYNPPFAIVTENDHSGYLIIACALGIALVALSIIIRIFLRSAFGHGFGTDDTVLFVATGFALVESAITWTAAGKGLGASVELIEPSDIPAIEGIFYATHILTIATLALAKCSVGFFILRLTPVADQRRLVWSIIAFTAAWTIASVLAMALQCNLSHPWVLIGGVRCPSSYTRVLVIGILDILVEIALVGVTVYMVAGLRAPGPTKCAVVLSFAFRLPLIVFITLRILHWNQATLVTNFTLAEDMYIIWTQIEIYYSLISATIPSLRPFVHSLTTHYGAGFSPGDHLTYAKASLPDCRSTTRPGFGQSIQMSRLGGKHSRAAEEECSMRPDNVDARCESADKTYVFSQEDVDSHIVARATHFLSQNPSAEDDASIGSNNSQRMIIIRAPLEVRERI